MTKTKLEVLGEQIMKEIQENKKWNERAVTNEALDRKLEVLMEYVRDIPKIKESVNKLQGDMDGVKAILQDHTERLRRLEERSTNMGERMDRFEVRMDQLEGRMGQMESRMGHLEDRT